MRVIAYIRSTSSVSRKEQVRLLTEYVERNDLQIVSSHHEAVSGNVPAISSGLWHALEEARAKDAKLLITRYDRLTRSVSTMAEIMRSGVDVITVENGSPNEQQVHRLCACFHAEAEGLGSGS